MRKTLQQGFTLIEMSIVLVIIGLIVGGILVGQDLIRAAQVRGAISELDKIKVAVNTFRGKYNCLPGDCGNITLFFAQDASCPDTAGGGTTTTCNGNGNGVIDGNESIFFFQHLSLANMIDETISLPQVASPDIPRFTTAIWPGDGLAYQNSYASHFYGTENGNVNVPTAVKGAGYSVVGGLAGTSYWDTFLGGTCCGNVPANFATSAYLLGGDGGNAVNYVPVMPTADAFAIDTKIDDGMPGTGNVQVWKDLFGYWPNNSLPYCYTTTNPATAQYNLSANGNICSLWFTTGF